MPVFRINPFLGFGFDRVDDPTAIGGGDMTKSTYDPNNDGKVTSAALSDDSTRLNNQLASFYTNRANHTGTQLASTISDFATAVGAANGNIQSNFTLTGTISPAAITANINNYNPTGLSTANVIFLSSTGNNDMTGLTAQENGRVLFVVNLGSGDVKLKNNNGSSLVANRFQLRADATLQPGNGGILIYNSTLQKWMLVALY